MIDSLLAKVFGAKTDREIKAIRPTVAAINDLEAGLQKLSDTDLAAKTIAFKERLDQGEKLVKCDFLSAAGHRRRVLGLKLEPNLKRPPTRTRLRESTGLAISFAPWESRSLHPQFLANLPPLAFLRSGKKCGARIRLPHSFSRRAE